MSWIFATILLLVTFAIAYQVSVLRKARKMEGQQAPLIAGDAEEQMVKTRLLYFYSPKCAPCRRMAPLIQELASEYGQRVVSMEVGANLETASAYQVRATPTTILVKEGKIEKVMLGYQPGARLRALLEG